jgi:uncharacterized protein DUF6766
MAPFLRTSSLSIFFFAIFLVTTLFQSIAGLHAYNEEAVQHGEDAIAWSEYVVHPEFGAAVVENWQSEWLQFFLFILATVWFLQKGSPESKELEKAGLESDEDQKVGDYADSSSPLWARVGGFRTRVYENSLVLAFGSIFVLSWLVQSLTGWREYNENQREHRDPTVGWGEYVTRPDFWERTLQNWQSEFLAVGTMAVFAIYLRQRGSPESKPVGEAHDATGVTG